MKNSIKVCPQYIEISCDRDDITTQTMAYSIPYIHTNRTRTAFTTSVRNIDTVINLFRDVNKLPSKVHDIYNNEMQRREATQKLLTDGPTGSKGWLYTHQQLGRELAKVNSRFAFFYDTRTGKTPMSLQIIADDIAANPDHKWLVLCPLILIENAWLPDAKTFFPELKVVNLHDTSKVERLKKYKLQANLYISNIESFVKYEQYIRQLPIHGCFVDESSSMKSSSSLFGKAAVKYSFDINQWYLLSGAPAPNGEWEYYRQLQSIDYFGIHQSYSKFKDCFFSNVSRSPQFEKLVIKPEKAAELLSILKKYSLYVDKEDVLTTPGRDIIPYQITMPKELKENYKKFKSELYLEAVNGRIIITDSAGGKYNKLNQISSGFIIDTGAVRENKIARNNKVINYVPKEEAYFLSDFKLAAVDNILQNIGNEQCIIWANYHKEFDVLKEHLGSKCDLVYGAVNITQKNKVLKDFKEGRIQYLIANPASANKGLTLTNAHFNIYYSMNYSYELWKQSIERIYGDISKQKNKCFYYILLATGTIDEVIFETVLNKGDMGQAVLSHLKGV